MGNYFVEFIIRLYAKHKTEVERNLQLTDLKVYDIFIHFFSKFGLTLVVIRSVYFAKFNIMHIL